jgi:SAM-dependent methyltransferase
MLAAAGARVLAIDISHGAAMRAAERARRHGLAYTVAVGDVERLPLRDRAVDIAYVHDGLHHLVDPASGIDEMARVAARAVSINEPADALATTIAVKVGMALRSEHAGNLVARLDRRTVAHHLTGQGFDVKSGRYFMYYKHEPGRLVRVASRPPAARAYRAAVRAADAAIGRWGNKVQVTATRRAAGTDASLHAAA